MRQQIIHRALAGKREASCNLGGLLGNVQMHRSISRQCRQGLDLRQRGRAE
jgi:hypothetical protein